MSLAVDDCAINDAPKMTVVIRSPLLSLENILYSLLICRHLLKAVGMSGGSSR
jgi:hypothetical protein